MNRVRLAFVVTGLILLTLILLPVQLVAIKMKVRLAARIPHLWHRVAAKLLGLKVRVEGTPVAGAPVLLLSNHVSWLDIVTLSVARPISFVAKAEVNSWPVVKWLARLQRTVFVDRTRRSAAGKSAGMIAERLNAGDAIVLFPEGTTGDGYAVLPFRSALVGAAREAAAGGEKITVQPMAVAYLGFHGMALARAEMPRIAWYGDMDLASHLSRLIAIGGVDAVVAFGHPMRFAADTDRKRITAAAEAEVRSMVRALHARRPVPVAQAMPVAPVLLNPAETG